MTHFTSIFKNVSLLSQEILNYPATRLWAKQEYQRSVCIFTKPTDLGLETLDIRNPFFPAKSIYKRSVSSFDDELWIMIEKCEKMGLITIEFLLPWDEGFEGEMFKSTIKNKDMIHEDLMKFIFGNKEEELSENQRMISNCLKSYLQYTMYPKFQNEIRENLISISGKKKIT